MKIKVIQRKSAIGRSKRQRDTLRGLGLNKLHKERILEDTPAIRGMINKVSHLIEWSVVENG
jgi:large subunit ribosomal protein L30